MTSVEYTVDYVREGPLDKVYSLSSRHSSLEAAEERFRDLTYDPMVLSVALSRCTDRRSSLLLKSWRKDKAGNSRVARQCILSFSPSCDVNTPPAGDSAGQTI